MTAPANAQPAGQPEPTQPVGPHPGDEPRANPAARWLTILIAIVLLACAGVVGRDLWYYFQNDDSSESWLRPVFEFVGRAVIDVPAVTVGIIIAIVGLFLIIYAFMPRAHTHVRVNSQASIWTRPVDIARKATNVTRSEVGNSRIQSRADRKKLRVQVEDDGTGASLQERLAYTLQGELQGLKTPPAISVKVLPKAQDPATAAGSPGTSAGADAAGTPATADTGSTAVQPLPEQTQGVQR